MGGTRILETSIISGGVFRVSGHGLPMTGAGPVAAMIRPERIRLTRPSDGWAATATGRTCSGSPWLLRGVLADGTELAIPAPGDGVALPDVADRVHITFRPEDVWLIPETIG